MKRATWVKTAAVFLLLVLLAGWVPATAAQAVAPDAALAFAGEDVPDETPPGPVPVAGLQLPETVTVKLGKKLALNAVVLPENAEDKSLTWKTSNKAVATVNAGGVVRAVAEGKVKITAVSANGIKASCVVYVGLPVSKVKLSPTKAKLTVGGSVALKAAVQPAEATNPALSWASSAPDVASVNSKGKVRAVAPGQAEIWVTTKDGGKTAKCVVTVYPKVESVNFVQGEGAELRLGGKLKLSAEVLPAEALDKSLQWKSSKPSVATVSANGRVLALASGKTTITAVSANGVKARFIVTVTGHMLFKGRNRVTSGYRTAERPDHCGIDVVGLDKSTVYATVSGRVRWARMVAPNAPGWGRTWEWGFFVWIEADDGTHHIYAHMAKQPKVQEGQRVAVGQALGVMGNTGYSFGIHTHYEVRQPDGRTPINPARYAALENRPGIYG